MEDIRVGEYIRTKYGIAKVIRDNKDEKAYFDNYDIDKELDGCNFINDFEILNHSFNIIDLIEVGDYVNEKKITNITWYQGEKQLVYEENAGGGICCYIRPKDIKSIVTKEQFDRERYIVGG